MHELKSLLRIYTCVPDRHQHDHTKDDVDGHAEDHLHICPLLPLLIFCYCEFSFIPIFIWDRHIDAHKEVNELVEKVSPLNKFSWGINLSNKSSQELNAKQNKEHIKRCLEWQSSVFWVVRGRSLGIFGVIPSVYIRLIWYTTSSKYQPRHLIWVSGTYEKWIDIKERPVRAAWA